MFPWARQSKMRHRINAKREKFKGDMRVHFPHKESEYLEELVETDTFPMFEMLPNASKWD